MAQLLLAVIMTVAVVLFAMSNAHHVEINYIIGEPVRIRMFFLLSIAFVAGAVAAFFFRLVLGISRRNDARLQRRWSPPKRDVRIGAP